MTLIRIAILLALAGCAPSATVAPRSMQGPDHQTVVAVAQRLFDAMRTRDTASLRAMLAPELVIVSVRTAGTASAETRRTTVSQFVASIARPGGELVERMWDPRVEIDGDIASLWAPYDFHIGGRFSHCGGDAIHFLRTNGVWKVVGLVYTVQTQNCPPPKP